MNTFVDLFRQPTRQAGATFPPDRRPQLFPGFVERSPRLHLWSPDLPVPQTGPRLLIGVATWSGYDMRLLDLLEELPSGGVRIDVFDVDTVSSPEEFEAMFPGIGFVHHTPVVGHWDGGTFVEAACGFDGRRLAARVCGLPPDVVQAQVNSILPQTWPHAPT